MRSSAIGWLLWAAVAFGLLNVGLSHDRLRFVQATIHAGRTPGALEAVRAYYTNDGDLGRYFAYGQATLGRPYKSYFVRQTEAWRAAFASGEPYRPDDMPEVAPQAALVPYRDFLVEYPPGFFLLVLPIVGLCARVGTFTLVFQSLMACALSLALVLATRVVTKTDVRSTNRSIAAWAALATLLLGVVATHRYDASIALVLSFGAWALVTERPVLLGLAAAAALALKGVPLIAFPPLAMVWLREHRTRDFVLCVAATVICAVAVLIPVLWVAGPTVLETARYHAARPVQIESTWGAMLGLIHAVRPALVTVERTFGSSNVTGRISTVFAAMSTAAAGIGLLAVYVITWRRMKLECNLGRRLVALEGVMASLVSFMVFGKVCSPQYLVWIFPLGLALSLTRANSIALGVLLGTFAVTQLIYPVSYGALESLRPWAVCLVLGRNALLLAWAGFIMRGSFSRDRSRESLTLDPSRPQ
jgi:hypothetical protein